MTQAQKYSWWIGIKKGLRQLLEVAISAALSAAVATAGHWLVSHLTDPGWLSTLGMPEAWMVFFIPAVRAISNRVKQTPFWRRLPGAVMLVPLLLLGPSVQAQETRAADPLEAPTFLGVYTWQEVIWQYVDQGKAGYQVERGEYLGGRVVGGLGLGRLGAELRLDVAGLKEQFAASDPATYATLEAYGVLHFVALQRHGVQLGPFVAGGSVSSKASQGGIGLDLWGGGVRIAGYGAEIHALVARHDYLPLGGWRLSLSGHIPISGPLAAVGDIVSGQDGYARVGLAVRIK